MMRERHRKREVTAEKWKGELSGSVQNSNVEVRNKQAENSRLHPSQRFRVGNIPRHRIQSTKTHSSWRTGDLVKVSYRVEGLHSKEEEGKKPEKHGLKYEWFLGLHRWLYETHTESLSAKNSRLDLKSIEDKVFLHLLLIRQYPLL